MRPRVKLARYLEPKLTSFFNIKHLGIILNRSTILPILILGFAAVLLTGPVLVFGFPNSGDANLHMAWHVAFQQQFWGGDIYPRWLRDISWGLGGPNFLFYPPVAFFASALLSPFAGSDIHGWHSLGMSATLGMFLSGLGAFLWLKTMTSQHIAVLVASIYMALPYHLGVDLYYRAAYAEYWSFAWMPFILFFTQRLASGNHLAILGLASCYALMIMTHPPTTLLFTPVAMLYGFASVRMKDRRQPLLIIAGFVWGILLSSIYLLPAMTMQEFTFAKLLWKGFSFAFVPKSLYWSIARHGFSYSSFHFVLHLSFVIPVVVLVLSAVWWNRYGENSGARTRLFIILSLVTLFFITPLSSFVWDIASFGKKVQFAWRLNAILCVALLPVIVGIIDASRFDPFGRWKFSLAIGGFLVLFTLVFTVWTTLNPESFDRDLTRQRIAHRGGMAEFTPIYAQRYSINPHNKNPNNRDWPKAEIISGTAETKVLGWKPGYLHIRIHVRSPSSVAIGQFYFPGWNLQLDGNCCLSLRWSPDDGRILVDLSEGVHDVELTLKPTRMERVGQVISGVALASLLLLVILATGRLRRKKVSVGGHGLSRGEPE